MSSFIKTIAFNHPRIYTNVFSRFYSTELPKYETLAVSVPKKYVYHVELNRPKKLNAFNDVMFREVRECFDQLHLTPECRVVVLSGQGKLFTAGIDLNTLVKVNQQTADIEDPARRARSLVSFIQSYQDSMSSLENCTKPVLNVIHNGCLGAGLNLITAADIRYCTEDAYFTVKEVDVGLAADIGVLQRLPKVVGNTSLVREICYTARDFSAAEALELGLVSKVFPDKDTALKNALQVAEEIASKSPIAVQTTKQNLVYSQSRPTEDGLLHIRLLNQLNLQSEDLVKSAIAKLSKSDEKPEFENV